MIMANIIRPITDAALKVVTSDSARRIAIKAAEGAIAAAAAIATKAASDRWGNSKS